MLGRGTPNPGGLPGSARERIATDLPRGSPSHLQNCKFWGPPTSCANLPNSVRGRSLGGAGFQWLMPSSPGLRTPSRLSESLNCQVHLTESGSGMLRRRSQVVPTCLPAQGPGPERKRCPQVVPTCPTESGAAAWAQRPNLGQVRLPLARSPGSGRGHKSMNLLEEASLLILELM